MDFRATLRKRAAPQLEDGEAIEQVIVATRINPFFGAFLGAVGLGALLAPLVIDGAPNLAGLVTAVLLGVASMMGHRLLVVTNRSVLVFRTSAQFPVVGNEDPVLLARLPRATRIGPVSRWFAKISLNGERMFVFWTFFRDVRAADAAAGYDSLPLAS